MLYGRIKAKTITKNIYAPRLLMIDLPSKKIYEIAT